MILGIDIGGTTIKFGLVDDKGAIVKKYRIATPVEQGDVAIVNALIDEIKRIGQECDFDRIGIGTPGTADYDTGVCIRASILPYKNTPLVPMIRAVIDKPVDLFNDAACAVGAELYVGLGQTYKNILMITLGTGVGGGIIIDGKMYHGKVGGAGEIGHMVIDQDGLLCPCGQRGCYELYASVTALIRQTKEAAGMYPDSFLAKLCREGVDGETVFNAKKAGCPVADRVLAQYVEYVAAGITSLYRILQPDVVVLGGAISNQEEMLLKPLREAMIWPVEIVTSGLKNDAGILGAAMMSMQK